MRNGEGKDVLRSGGDGVPLLKASKNLAFLSSVSFADVHGPSLAFCGELDGGVWKLVPLVYKRGGHSDGQYQDQGEGAYHARFFLCLIKLPTGTRGPGLVRFIRGSSHDHAFSA
jgi:hypothetical protein